jgi:hypothetical protein
LLQHWSLVFTVLMIATGLCMFTYKSTDFSAIGFIMVLSARSENHIAFVSY